jgi:hypothetical protein
MPRTETVLRVFVASPRDLSEERATLEGVIRELNNTWSTTLGIRLELVAWETHTLPGFGADAQDVINEQIADDYDIFIGMMWARFGTPTGRAGSGTAEEFHRAYRRHKENPNQVRIMFYFKNAPIPPSDLDPEQLVSIQKFQAELGEKGGYYWTFNNRDEFAQLVRMHLARQVQAFGTDRGEDVSESEPEVQPQETLSQPVAEVEPAREGEVEDDEEGYLDLMETWQDSFETMNAVTGRMSTALEELSAKMNAGTKDLNEAKQPSGDVDIKTAKKITNRIAEALNNFAALMEADVPIFANSYSAGMEAFSRAFPLVKELGQQDKEDLVKTQVSIQQLISSMSETREQMRSFRDVIAGLPRATALFNRARRRAISILDKLDEEYGMALNLSSEVEKGLRDS